MLAIGLTGSIAVVNVCSVTYSVNLARAFILDADQTAGSCPAEYKGLKAQSKKFRHERFTI